MPDGYKHFSKTKPMRSEHCDPLRTWWYNRTEIISEDGKDEKARAFTASELLELGFNLDQCKFPKEEEEILAPAELLENYYKRRFALEHEIDKTLTEVQRILGIDINTTEQ